VPEKKSAIEQNRVAAGLHEEKKILIGLLRKKLTALDWNTDQFDKEIDQLKQEIAALQKDISDYRRKFTALKGRALEAIGGIVNEYVEVISARTARNQPYDDLIVNMIDDIKSQVESSMNELKIIEIKFFDKNIGSLIQALVEKNAGQIKDIAGLVTDAATFALTAWIVPGPTSGLDPGEALIGAGVVFAEQAEGTGDGQHKGGKVSGFGKVLGTISQMIKGMNPLEKLKNVVLPHLINPGVARALTRKMKEKLLVVYDSIGQAIEKEIETRYLTPLRDHESVLTETRKEKTKKTEQTDADRIAIEDVISKLTLLK